MSAKNYLVGKCLIQCKTPNQKTRLLQWTNRSISMDSYTIQYYSATLTNFFKILYFTLRSIWMEKPLKVLMSFFTPREEKWMRMMNISNNVTNTLISLIPCFSIALCSFHTSCLSGSSHPFAVFICFKERQFTLWAMQLGRLLLFYFPCPSPCSALSLSSFW